MIVIILAGGCGQRLWPLSTVEMPKQFIKIWDHLSLFQKTFDRFAKSSKVDEIIIITSSSYEKIVQEQIAELNLNKNFHVILEPKKKNTAPAILLALRFIQEILQKDKSNILVTPSDHYISSNDLFLKTIEKLDKDLKKIVTFGILPTRAEVGYGYIKVKKKVGDDLYLAEKFVEKPSYKKALEYIKSKNFYWNMGLLFFPLHLFSHEIFTHMKSEFLLYEKGYDYMIQNFDLFRDISIDFALMEKLRNFLFCPLDLHWSDLGIWDNLYDVLNKDESFNVIIGNVSSHNTKNSLLISENRKIVAFDVEDLIVIETKEALLIGKKGSSHKLKSVIPK